MKRHSGLFLPYQSSLNIRSQERLGRCGVDYWQGEDAMALFLLPRTSATASVACFARRDLPFPPFLPSPSELACFQRGGPYPLPRSSLYPIVWLAFLRHE
jgi:hypothetical protein